jgi:D-glycero-alpha-D-manno-heptose-7-phosphate kinase
MSLIGGGTDFKSFYSRENGIVVSAAINKYVYVHVKRHDPMFMERFRISYSEVEKCDSIEHIKNQIVKNCLKYLDIDEPLQISISSDLPSNSGLGSSSSFTVALLLALHTMKGDFVSNLQLAEEACKIEIEMIGSPIGKQDQYAAATGGLNLIEFFANEKVQILELKLSQLNQQKLFSNIALIWTGKLRNAKDILQDQEQRNQINYQNLIQIKNLALQFTEEISKPNLNFKEIGSLINQSWSLKQNLSPLIIDEAVYRLMHSLVDLPIMGQKILGAGGGGFLLTIYENINDKILSQLKTYNYFIPRMDQYGCRVLSRS